MAYEDFKAV